MNPKEYIQKYGGKIGGYVFLRDLGGFEDFLPRADILDWDHDFDDIPNKNKYVTSSVVGGRFIDGIPVIVRGIHAVVEKAA